MSSDPLLICVVGPTAIGKTALGIQLASHFNAEIISADSRQVYQEINIGTAKPSSQELAQAKHHFIDFLPLESEYSAGKFEKESIEFLSKYFDKRKVCICVGGSGLYINALLYGFDDLPSNDEIRNKLNKELEDSGIESLQKNYLN